MSRRLPKGRSPLFTSPELAERRTPEPSPKFRNEFSRDRDRILYSKQFRRLAGKTQVFVSGFDDHFRTRLTHTLEVSQIARTVTAALGLNSDLAEAIALGHDVGHTPFGHAGERWLNLLMSGCYSLRGIEEILVENRCYRGFRHNWQSVRAVEVLEDVSKQYRGLNLTLHTIWGMLHHTGLTWSVCPHSSIALSARGEQAQAARANSNPPAALGRELTGATRCSLLSRRSACVHGSPDGGVPFYTSNSAGLISAESWSAEALVVRIADEIAQRHHDIEDGILAGLLDVHEVIGEFEKIFYGTLARADKTHIKEARALPPGYAIPELSRLVVNFLTSRLINDTKALLTKKGISRGHEQLSLSERSDIWSSLGWDLVNYSEEFLPAEDALHNFLKVRVLGSHLAQSMDGKAGFVIRQLFKAFLTNPEQLPDRTIYLLHRRSHPENGADNGGSRRKIPPTSTGKARGWLRETLKSEGNTQLQVTLLRTICDFLAGMTDSYAMSQFELLYGSRLPRRSSL